MSNLLVTSSVSAAALLTNYTINTSHKADETSSEAINIGDLDEQSSVVSVSQAGSSAGAAASSTFTGTAGSTTSLSQSFTNVVTEAATRYQLYDGSGAVVADNQGTAAQQTAYTEWVDGTLTLGSSGTYTAVATPATGSAVSLTTSQQQGTSLGVNSQLTGGDTNEYYNFSLSGTNIKLSFDAGSGQSSTRVQLYNSSGVLVADSDGNAYMKSNYLKLTSGTGLIASSGDYSVKVSYAPGADTTQNINYNMQLYSGKSYAVVYNNNVTAQPADYTASGSVTAATDALAYSRQAYNQINEKAADAVNIGWLAENQSSLNVLSQLTPTDNADLYSFTLQSGNNLKFGFDTTQTANPSDLRVQILDGSGLEVIADSAGTAAQQAAYKALTTTDGLTAKPGNYIVKVSYAPGVTKSAQTYDMNLYSGTSFSAQYKTIASPESFGTAALKGQISGSSNSTAMAAYLTGASNGAAPDVMSTLQALA